MDKIAHIPGFVAHHYLHVFDVEEIILKRSIMCSWCTAWLSVPTRSLKDSSTSDWRLARHGSYLPRARCRTSLEIIIVGAEGSCIVRWNFFWKGEEKGEEKGERRKREKVSLSLCLSFSLSLNLSVCLSGLTRPSRDLFTLRRLIFAQRRISGKFASRVSSNDSWIHEGIKERRVREILRSSLLTCIRN